MAQNRPTRLRRLAVIECAGETWRFLAARLEPSLSVEAALEFPHADSTGLAAAVNRAKPDQLIVMIPLGATLCRPVVGASAPAGDPAQIASAMRLVAEAQLGVGVPAHRRVAGVLPVGGMVCLGWSGPPALLPSAIEARDDAVYMPHIVALSALAKAAGSSLALLAEREGGAILVVGSSGAKSIARATREDGSDRAEWQAGLESTLAAAASSIGQPAPILPDAAGPRTLALLGGPPDRARLAKIPGASPDRAWLERFGPALGAALAAGDADPAVQPLLAMTPEEIIPPQPVFLRLVDWFSLPSRGLTIIAASVLLAMAWPLAAAAIRFHRLDAIAKADRVAQQGQREEDARRQAEFFDLLRGRRWPLSKLLSDLTAAAPQGVTLESLNVEVSADKALTISGSADSSQAVADWCSALQKGGVFSDVKTPTIEGSSPPLKFQVTAKVAQPFRLPGSKDIPVAPAVPLAPAAATAPSEPARPPGASAPASGRTERSAPAGRARRTPGGAPEAVAPKGGEIPAPLADADIAAMDRSTAMKEFTSRKAYVQKNPSLDEETKKRLLDEAEKCKTQMQKAPAAPAEGSGNP